MMPAAPIPTCKPGRDHEWESMVRCKHCGGLCKGDLCGRLNLNLITLEEYLDANGGLSDSFWHDLMTLAVERDQQHKLNALFIR